MFKATLDEQKALGELSDKHIVVVARQRGSDNSATYQFATAQEAREYIEKHNLDVGEWTEEPAREAVDCEECGKTYDRDLVVDVERDHGKLAKFVCRSCIAREA